MSVPVPAPVIASGDPDLLDELSRLSATAGIDTVTAAGPAAAAAAWRVAPRLLVGPDLVAPLAALGLPRRPGVVVVCDTAVEPDAAWWREVVALGAEDVRTLPRDEAVLVRLLADADGSDVRGAVVAVIGGCGGAGASVLGVGLALAAVRAGRSALLVDLDPWGGGADLLLGAEQVPGLRWRDLAGLSGTVSGAVLGDALPRPEGVGVVAWDRDGVVAVPPTAVRAVLDAGARRHDLVVVDLPRRSDELGSLVLARASATFVVVPAEVRAAAAAAQAVAALAPGTARVVVRTGRGWALEPELVAAALQLPLAAVVSDERQVTAAVAAGDPPGAAARSRLAAVCDALVREVCAEPRGGAGRSAA